MGADLNIEEFLLLKRVLFASRELKSFYENLENVRLDHLANWFEKLHDLPHLQGNLQAINEAGFIENFASEELARIRRKSMIARAKFVTSCKTFSNKRIRC